MRYDKTKYRKHPTDDHLSDILIITNSAMELDYKIHVCLKTKNIALIALTLCITANRENVSSATIIQWHTHAD